MGLLVLEEYEGEKRGRYVKYVYEEKEVVGEVGYWKGRLMKGRR